MAIGIALGALSIASNVFGMSEAREGRQDARRARRLRNKQVALENERKVREFARTAQQQRAAQLAEAGSMGEGTTSSSTFLGATGSLRSRIGGELNFFSQMEDLGGSIAGAEGSAQDHMNRANTFSAVGNIFGSAGDIFG